MKLVTYALDGAEHVGVMTDEGIIPLSILNSDMPDEMHAVVAGGSVLLNQIADAIIASSPTPLDPTDVALLAPFPRPRRNVFCVGKNYYAHAREFEVSGFDSSSAGQQIPEVPIIFTKATTSVVGSGDTVESALDPTGSVDYEGELAVVIGTGGRGINSTDAMKHVYGYTIINDVTSRDIQRQHKQWFLGKSMDTFCPMGPVITTADELHDIRSIQLTTRVNGEVRQNASVKDLIFDIPRLIETLSKSMTLEPGDLIATGTPAGVGIGFTPPRYLQPGDHVEVEISGIGVLANPIG
ncbi:fumarylacetoacetate hydrolase family protein [Hoeflea sp. G2-23]|uniref:Fumarylacetoacetate hydrolase family protein n=1 Tax=Hoeflea algicola TaxID=2983763 RepID=A0ABT3Z8R9_9HYPH|nr:fumarylacetoacetate hydrolase family protein [Hoeflea algicola]MCY0148170.1 fumarylacetoacetate hydrolase family protein [Hoeflea algicola]